MPTESGGVGVAIIDVIERYVVVLVLVEVILVVTAHFGRAVREGGDRGLGKQRAFTRREAAVAMNDAARVRPFLPLAPLRLGVPAGQLVERRHAAHLLPRVGASQQELAQVHHTSTSMGRLVLHILLSFAQFERELISERTRDKIAAARRRGKWTGGPLVLGYRVDRQRRALEVVPDEAAIVKLAFELYERTLSVALTAQRLNARGLTLRARVAEDGTTRGRPFNKNAVHWLLRNPRYVGKVRHNDDIFLGEHEPIVDPDVFDRVQRTLDLRAAGAGTRRPRRSESLLTGLLRCVPCDAAMSTSHAYNHKKQRYRYYRCRASQEGLRCPTGLLNAIDVEAAVVAQVKTLAKSGALRDRIVATLGACCGKRNVAERGAMRSLEDHGQDLPRVRAEAEVPPPAIA